MIQCSTQSVIAIHGNGDIELVTGDGKHHLFSAHSRIGEMAHYLAHQIQYGAGRVPHAAPMLPPDYLDIEAAKHRAAEKAYQRTAAPTPCWHCGYTDGHAPSCKAVPRDGRDA